MPDKIAPLQFDMIGMDRRTTMTCYHGLEPEISDERLKRSKKPFVFIGINPADQTIQFGPA